MANPITYSSQFLLQLAASVKQKLKPELWCRLKTLDIHVPTPRGKRAGFHCTVRNIQVLYSRTTVENRRSQTGVCSANLIHIKTSQTPQLSCLRCVLLNTQSVCNKAVTVSEHLSDQGIDLAFLTETWLKSSDTTTVKELCPPGFSFKHNSRQKRRGGGIGLLYRSSLDVRVIKQTVPVTTFECQSFYLHGPTLLAMAIIYRPPSRLLASNDPFLSEFERFIIEFTSKPGKLLICGDFNIHVDEPCTTGVQQFLDILS